jgi:3-oxoacyl-[acyl-carrier-protein] synthase-3
MTLAKFEHVKISGISAVVPEKEINIYDELEYYNGSVKKVDRMRKMVGFWKRRVVDEGVTASDLSIQATENLIQKMNINKDTIDAIIFVRQRPDFSSPATAFYIAGQLNLPKSVMAFDICLGCTGWMQGLFVAHSLIESHAYKRVLLLAGDTPSVDMKVENRISAPVFGDGGSATLLEYSNDTNLSYFDVGADSSGFEAIIKPASGYRLRLKSPLDDNDNKEILEPLISKSGYQTNLQDFYMDGTKVFEFTIKEVPASIKRVLEYAKLTQENIDYLMLHQANKQIVQAIANESGFGEEKAPYSSFENYGNESVTSIPISINHNFYNKLSNEKILCCAFGSGLAWCSGIFNFNNIYYSGVKNYIKPKDKASRQDLIKYWKQKIKGEQE